MRIFFFANYSIIGPSSRYRIYNFINKYRDAGIACKTSNFWGNFYLQKVLSQKKRLLRLLLLCFYYPLCISRRYLNIISALQYDLIHIERDFCPGMPPLGEQILAKILRKKIVYELDDAVYLTAKPEGKIEKAMALAKGVIAGNEILAEYARKYCENILVVPTVIDTAKYSFYNSRMEKNTGTITIGWIGTFSTIRYLEIVKDAIAELSKVHQIQLNVICNRSLEWDNGVKINNIPWTLDTYIEELCRFDIGIMPLCNSDWELGKCGFKLIQYMGVGIPVVASPVGINSELVNDGVNGYIAVDHKSWYDVLELLITSESLRKSFGEAGRKLAQEKYSIEANAPRLIDFFKYAAGESK